MNDIEASRRWYDKVIFRRNNKLWLSYSRKVALRILSAMEDWELDENKFAELTQINIYTIRNILNGSHNLTLEEISIMAAVLKAELISFPEFKYNTSL